ncbi:MAG: hypothetical protein JW929_06290 [Anaerolineales bacterium]|nr:hypothetical protein [Anaerolineales bacterium]
MITLFTSTKPFQDAVAVTQRNTIACWRRLRPACEVLLIGEEKGSAEAAREFGARLIPDVERSEFGTPLLRSMFSVAEANARFPVLLYANADILFTGRLIRAAQALASWPRPYMLFGRRWDTDLREPFDFSGPDWETRLEAHARAHGKPAIKSALDYFMFPKGAWGGEAGLAEFPPIVIGRPAWDNWIVFWCLARRMDAVNGSDFILAVHQNHDYGHHAGGQRGVYAGEEAKRNFALASYERYLYGTPDATHRVRPDGRIVRAYSADILRRRIRTFPDLMRVWVLGRKRWKPG